MPNQKAERLAATVQTHELKTLTGLQFLIRQKAFSFKKNKKNNIIYIIRTEIWALQTGNMQFLLRED